MLSFGAAAHIFAKQDLYCLLGLLLEQFSLLVCVVHLAFQAETKYVPEGPQHI